MDLLPIYQWAEDTRIGEMIRGNTWPFPLIETFHILALAVFVGALFRLAFDGCQHGRHLGG